MHTTFVLSALLLGLLVGCPEDDVAPPGETLRSSVPRQPPSADLGPASELAANNADFAFALLREAAPTDNFFFSPHSISMALGMTYAGAAGDTATDMRAALRFRQEPVELHAAFNTLDQELASRGEGAHGVDGTPFRLRITNGLFAQSGFPILPSYLDLVAENYGAGLTLLDFLRDPEGSRTSINDWIDTATEHRIPELLPEHSIDPTTVMVLTNAVYFNAAWELPFPPDGTADGPFLLADGSTVTVPLMHGPSGTASARGPGWRAAEIPYEGEDVAMLIIVPDDLAAFEETLDGARYQDIVESLHDGGVTITMPRFSIRSQLSLRPALSALGMGGAFVSADFSAMTSAGGLFISDAVHEAWVRVSEEGTEAAAATAVIIGRSILPELSATRPFLYVVRDRPTGAVIFAGRVSNPALAPAGD
jgi:serpin B